MKNIVILFTFIFSLQAFSGELDLYTKNLFVISSEKFKDSELNKVFESSKLVKAGSSYFLNRNNEFYELFIENSNKEVKVLDVYSIYKSDKIIPVILLNEEKDKVIVTFKDLRSGKSQRIVTKFIKNNDIRPRLKHSLKKLKDKSFKQVFDSLNLAGVIHSTSFENAFSIIESKKLLMRNKVSPSRYTDKSFSSVNGVYFSVVKDRDFKEVKNFSTNRVIFMFDPLILDQSLNHKHQFRFNPFYWNFGQLDSETVLAKSKKKMSLALQIFNKNENEIVLFNDVSLKSLKKIFVSRKLRYRFVTFLESMGVTKINNRPINTYIGTF